MSNRIENRLHIKELELKSLIDTIRLINSNASEEDLYRIYKFSLHAAPRITKMALYVLDEQWVYKTGFGFTHNYQNLALPESLLSSSKPNDLLSSLPSFQEFDQVLAVEHQQKILAYSFFGFDKDIPANDPQTDMAFLETLCQIIIVTLENKRMSSREVERQSYKAQLEIAHEVQTLLFPKSLPDKPNQEVHANYLPHHRVGGDYYDYLDFEDGSFLMCVADVSGKGVPAALLMSNFQAGLRLLSKQQHALTNIVIELNSLVMNNAQGANFITAFFLWYDAPNQSIRYINAGHNPPFIFVQEEWRRLEEGTTIVGGFDELPFLEEGIIEDVDEFFVFCFTDGFIENYDEEGGIFGEDRLLEFLKEHYELPLSELHNLLIHKLQEFAGGNEYADDVTLLSCRLLSK